MIKLSGHQRILTKYLLDELSVKESETYKLSFTWNTLDLKIKENSWLKLQSLPLRKDLENKILNFNDVAKLI
jgi:hypothetical protein